MRIKKLLALLLCTAVLLAVLPVYTSVGAAETTATVYVSSTGSNSNDGSEASPYQTFEKAFKCAKAASLTIVLKDSVAVPSSFVFNNGNDITTHTTVTAISSDVAFDITAKTAIGFYDDVTFTGLTINFTEDTVFCAGGRNVVIADDVTFTNRIKAFGGGYNTTVASTNMTLNGGIYKSIYAGSFGGSVTGNAVLNVGGNVNKDDGIDDENSATVSPCRIYGGSYSGTVGGSTTINYSGNAVSRYISGSGYSATDTVTGNININISGGKVMNVYGGSLSANVNTDVFIYMTGGLAEAVFGGSESLSTTGNVYMYFGGTADVSRRIYGGCYNNWSLTWGGSNYVTGTITIAIDNGCSIASKTGLASGNQDNMGLFAGSRAKSNQAGEVSTLIFLNDCYDTYKSKIGDTSGWSYVFKPHTDYTVKATAGGNVKNSTTAGTITLLPNEGKAAKIDSAYFANGDTYALTSATTNVSFVDLCTLDFDLTSADTATEIDSITAVEGQSVTVPSTDAAKLGYTFAGWTTAQDGAEAEYQANDSIVLSGNLTLYPVWKAVSVKYKINHYYENHYEPGNRLYKTEYKEGYAFEMTEAEALDMLGYTVSTISQKEIQPNGSTTISIFYSIEDDTKAEFSDVNADGVIDLLDAVCLQRCLAGWQGYDQSKVCMYAADCNVDGKVSANDILTLLSQLAGNNPSVGKPDTEDNWGGWV